MDTLPGPGFRASEKTAAKGGGDGERERVRGWREEERGGGKKAAAGLRIKTGANPFCIVQHNPLPLPSPTLPLGAFMERHFADSGSYLSDYVVI